MAESFARRLAQAAARYPERPALLVDGAVTSHRELQRQVAACAGWLSGRGLAAGDRLAVAIGNRPAFVVGLLAGLALGATVAPVDPLLKTEEREALLADLSPALVIDDLPDAALAGDGPPPPLARDGAAPALVLYTSGSTGRPKGSALSHAALSFAIGSWAGPVMELTADDVVLGVLPFAHSFGLNGALLAPLATGAAVAVVERFTPETVVAALVSRAVTVFPGVATMFRRLLDSRALDGVALERLRFAVSGAAPCPWDLAREWRERTGVRIVRGYGMTELFRPISYLAGDPADVPDSIGRAVPGVELRIVDEDGRTLGADQVGELWIRTPACMDAYLGAPEETRAVLERGWFRTGDLAVISPEGWVGISGRKRDRILRGGYSVFPAEVEAVLVTHPAVAEAAVVGRAHPELGEEVIAFVALHPDAEATPDALIAHCRERLAAFKYPRQVVLVPALPRSATGKVLRSRLLAP
jgi:long-chain acyl-CoA synthetase